MGWLVTGASGMLGTDLCRVLDRNGISVTRVDRGDLNLLDPVAVGEAVAGHEVVVNCAAWTAVDLAEAHEAEALEINATAAGVLARAAGEHGALVVHVSTDYVFDGTARTPYDEDASPSPLSAYGRTKAAGERTVRVEAPERHLILRTAWLYGAHGSCFPRTIARRAIDKGAVDVVDDQVGPPTWTRDVADLMVRLVQAEAPTGTWHATAGGQTTWCGFAREVVAAVGLPPDVISPVDSATFPREAPRPAYSVLGRDRLVHHGIEPIGHWQQRWRVAASEVLELEQLE
ncbi:MAG: dTDP-4-dehydrorhamnose reductase [Marmoricola sp.]